MEKSILVVELSDIRNSTTFSDTSTTMQPNYGPFFLWLLAKCFFGNDHVLFCLKISLLCVCHSQVCQNLLERKKAVCPSSAHPVCRRALDLSFRLDTTMNMRNCCCQVGGSNRGRKWYSAVRDDSQPKQKRYLFTASFFLYSTKKKQRHCYYV